MSRKTEQPEKYTCPKAPANWFGKRSHRWQWGSSWNGNDPMVLGFDAGSRGLVRSGWRCYHCGRFVWDESDTAYALTTAYAMGYLPQMDKLKKKEIKLVGPLTRAQKLDLLIEHTKDHQSWGPSGKKNMERFCALALCGEAGELANLIKKDWRGDDGDRKTKIIQELADVGNYVLLLAAVLDVEIVDWMYQKLLEIEERPEFKNAKGWTEKPNG